MINIAMNMNKIIIRDVNLSFNVEKFLKEFAKICIVFLINFFFEYNQVILIKKSRDLTAFIIFKFVSNDSTFAKRNQLDDEVRSNNLSKFLKNTL